MVKIKSQLVERIYKRSRATSWLAHTRVSPLAIAGCSSALTCEALHPEVHRACRPAVRMTASSAPA